MQEKTRIDSLYIAFTLLLTGVTVLVAWEGAIGNPILRLLSSALMLIEVVIVLPVIFYTRYTLEENKLRIRFGIFVNMRIEYEDIRTLERTENLIASCALSRRRLAVRFEEFNGKEEVVYISPKDIDTFARQLQKRVTLAHLLKDESEEESWKPPSLLEEIIREEEEANKT